MKLENAAVVGENALIFLAGRPELLEACLAQSGLDATEVRARSGEPEFLGFILDFLLQSDAWVQDFAKDAGLRPEDVASAREALGGGTPNWT